MDYQKQETFKNGYSAVYYYEQLKLIENKWLEDVSLSSEEYREPFKHALDFAKENNVDFFLSDIRQQGVIPVSEKKWFKEVVFPEAAKLGVKYVAIVTTSNIFKTYYINAITKLGNVNDIPVKTFNDYERAFKWLISH